MTDDARFEDGVERPLRLKAEDGEDVAVIAALVQDSILTGSEMQYERGRRRFSMLLSRFRWEDKPAAERRGRDFERVRAVLAIDDVMGVARQGLDPKDGDTVLSLLTLGWEPGEDWGGASGPDLFGRWRDCAGHRGGKHRPPGRDAALSRAFGKSSGASGVRTALSVGKLKFTNG